MTDYLNLDEILSIHDDQIAQFGGKPGIRDLGLVESALFRPQTGYYDDLIQEAAALWESLSQNHPFIDGNKRTSFAATDVFLKINGIEVDVEPRRAYEFIMNLYESGEFNITNLETWLRKNTAPIV